MPRYRGDCDQRDGGRVKTFDKVATCPAIEGIATRKMYQWVKGIGDVATCPAIEGIATRE